MTYFTLMLILIVAMLLLSAFRVLREYERGVIFLLGRFHKVKGPGLIIVIPVVQQAVKVDLRTVVMDVPSQDVISRDNVSVQVSAVVYLRVTDPEKAIIQVEDYVDATSQLAQTTLRSVLGQHDLDAMLAQRDQLNADIQAILDQHTDAWGVKVSNVEIKHVDLNETMVRAIAKQAEAAEILARQDQAIQLRYLQTLTEIAGEKSSTIVFPIPVEFLSNLMSELGARKP